MRREGRWSGEALTWREKARRRNGAGKASCHSQDVEASPTGTGLWLGQARGSSAAPSRARSQGTAAPCYHCSPSQAPLRGWWFCQTGSPAVKVSTMLQRAKLGAPRLHLLSKWNDILEWALIGSNLGCLSCPSCLKHSQAPFCDDFLRVLLSQAGACFHCQKHGVWNLIPAIGCRTHKAARLAYSVRAEYSLFFPSQDCDQNQSWTMSFIWWREILL